MTRPQLRPYSQFPLSSLSFCICEVGSCFRPWLALGEWVCQNTGCGGLWLLSFSADEVTVLDEARGLGCGLEGPAQPSPGELTSALLKASVFLCSPCCDVSLHTSCSAPVPPPLCPAELRWGGCGRHRQRPIPRLTVLPGRSGWVCWLQGFCWPGLPLCTRGQRGGHPVEGWGYRSSRSTLTGLCPPCPMPFVLGISQVTWSQLGQPAGDTRGTG